MLQIIEYYIKMKLVEFWNVVILVQISGGKKSEYNMWKILCGGGDAFVLFILNTKSKE